MLFSIFSTKGIEYRRGHDFNFPNGYASFLKVEWTLENDRNREYGNRPTKKIPPPTLMKDVRTAVMTENRVDISGKDVTQLQMTNLFLCGTLLLMRGVDVSIFNSMY